MFIRAAAGRLHEVSESDPNIATGGASFQLSAREVGTATAFLCSPLASAITGTTLYVDKGFHTMGMAVEEA